MVDYFTSCLDNQVEEVKKHLKEVDLHEIVEVFGPFDEVTFQFTDDTPVKCGGQPGEGRVKVIHSKK